MVSIPNFIIFRIVLPWLGTFICQSNLFKCVFGSASIALIILLGNLGFGISFILFAIYPPIFQRKIWKGIQTNEAKTYCVLEVVDWQEEYI